MKREVKEKFQEVVNVNRKGYTILELIIVIVIAGIMAAVAIPKIGNVSNVDVYTAARLIKSDIRYTQQRAMSKFRTTTIAFTGGTDSYTISTVLDGTISSKKLPSSSGATFDANYAFSFASDGDPAATNGWSVLISSGGETGQIDVSDTTGRATVN